MRLMTMYALAGPMAATMIVAGCQVYEREPLNPEAHRRAWHERTPASAEIRAFARRLDEYAGSASGLDPSDGVTLPEAEIIALVFNPDLRLARARAHVAIASAEGAGLREDPELRLDVSRITESVPDPWVISTGLALTIPLSGRLSAEQSRAASEVRAEIVRVAEAERDMLTDLRIAWAKHAATQLRLEETLHLTDQLESLVNSTSRLADAGELPRTEASLFRIERGHRDSQLRRLRGRIAESEQQIRSILGLTPKAPVVFITSLAPDEETNKVDLGSLEANLTLARLGHEYEVAEQKLRREILKQYPDLTLGPSYESDEGHSRIGFLSAVPLPILNANRRGIAEARAERELARAAYETEYERLAGVLATAQARKVSIREQRDEIERNIIPLVDQQLANTRRLLQMGEGGSLVLLESLTRAHETKLELIELLLDEAVTAARIRQLTRAGSSLMDPNAPAVDAGTEVTQ